MIHVNEQYLYQRRSITIVDAPTIKVFQIHHEEFLFLGIENVIVGSIQNADFVAIWERFFSAGGFEKIEAYQKDSYRCMVIYHKNDSEHLIYFIGSIVEGIDKAPEGYKLSRFPACEFLVVTTEWLPTKDEALSEKGLGQCSRYEQNVQIPDGYTRFDGPDSEIMLIERENFDTPYGSRYEYWVPIKKSN